MEKEEIIKDETFTSLKRATRLAYEIQEEIGDTSLLEYLRNKKYEDTKNPEARKRIVNEMTLRKLLEERIIDEEVINSQIFNIAKAITTYTNKRNLARQFIKIQPVYYDESKLWWLWNFKLFKWQLIDETDILNMISKNSHANTISSKEKVEIIESLKQEGRLNKPKSIEPTWIQFKNKITDFKTGREFEATPEFFSTNPIPWELNKDKLENTPVMDRIFEEWVGKENVKTLYEIISYCLIPSYPIHRLFCFLGAGMNGKSCFLRLLNKFVGIENVTATELDTLINSRFEITKLYKKLVCVMGETNFNELSRTSIIKKLTGQDCIGFEFKNKNPFEGENYAKILIATNNLPTTTDKSIGFYRRWMIIDFPNRFSEQKEILDEIPDEEYESLALKSLCILKDLLESRKFTNEGTVEERMERYESKSDFLQKFLNEFTEEDLDSHITKADFRKKFSEWCFEKRHRDMAESTLSKKLKEKGIEPGRKYVDWLYNGKGGQLNVYLNIKWKN